MTHWVSFVPRNFIYTNKPTVPAVIAVSAAKGAAIGAVTGAAIGAGQSVISNRVSTGSWKGTKDADHLNL